MAELLLCPQTLRCHTAELEPGSEGLKLFSHLQHGCRPSLLDHTPQMKPNKHNREHREAKDRHYTTHPYRSEVIPDYCPTPLCMKNQLFSSGLLKRWFANE